MSGLTRYGKPLFCCQAEWTDITNWYTRRIAGNNKPEFHQEDEKK